MFEMTWGVWGLSFVFTKTPNPNPFVMGGGGGGREREARVSEFFNKESK